MDSTSISLLNRLTGPKPDEADWERLVDLYAPLVFLCGKKNGFNDADADDLVQEIMQKLIIELPKFEYDPKRSFRGWLRRVTVNKIRDIQRRRKARPDMLAGEPAEAVATAQDIDLFEEAEYRAYVIARGQELFRDHFKPRTWQAAWMLLKSDRTAADVGQELGMTANAALIARSRVLAKLRLEFDGLID